MTEFEEALLGMIEAITDVVRNNNRRLQIMIDELEEDDGRTDIRDDASNH